MYKLKKIKKNRINYGMGMGLISARMMSRIIGKVKKRKIKGYKI